MSDHSINQIRIQHLIQQQQQLNNQSNRLKTNEFEKILDKKLEKTIDAKPIHFSKHARQRLNERQIEVREDELEKLNEALHTAKEKGIKNPLIVGENLICIANTDSKTIITIMDTMKDKVFTNVDGVVNI
jgi:flagellar operon protein